jgi:two-component system cell cycle sensor histidine kinase/response regulator CckA
MDLSFVRGSRTELRAAVYRYGSVIFSVAGAVLVSVVLRGYVYPRPLALLALVLSMWGRGLGPGLVGAGMATALVGVVFPELEPTYGILSDAAMFILAAVACSAFSGAKARAEAQRTVVEQELRESGRRLLDAQRLAQVGSWERNLGGEAIHWSDEMFRIFGLPAGTPPDYETSLQYVHPEDREKISAANQQAISRNEPVIVEYRVLRTDGTVRSVRSVVEVRKNDQGVPVRIAGATQDITEQVQAKAALRGTEERFRAIVFQAAVGIAEVGLQGEWLLVNDRLCEIVGYTREELRTKTLLELTDPEDREHSLAAVRLLLEGGGSWWSKEIRHVRKDGSIRWASLCISLVRGQDNYLIAVVEDVTDRVQAERALRESEGRLKLVQSAARLGVWDMDIGANRIAALGEYAYLHGLAPDHPPLTYEQWLELVHPADRERMQKRLRECLERTHVWDQEFRVVWPDGSVHWLLAKGTVYNDHNGRPTGLAGVSLDITERREAEGALRESEERFRRVFEEGPLGLALVSKDYHFLKANSALCRMTGYTEAELTQLSFEDITHPEDIAKDRELAERLFRREISNYQLQKRYVKKNGDVIWINLTAAVIRDAEGLPLYGLAMIEDITEAKRAQEEAVARQKLESVGILASGIAHDFNNLLGSILAEAELAQAAASGGSSPREELQAIMTIARRGAEIVRELMIYSGQDKSKVVAPVNVSELVEEMLELLKVSISKHAVLKTDLAANLPVIVGNAPQIRQILMNLMINASEAIGTKSGVIHISTSRVTAGAETACNDAANLPAGEYLRLMISDTGCGMTEGEQARIFDPFFSTKFAGRGLGLAVVQGIVRAHGGGIHIVSAPGQGTTFQIFFPCGKAPAQVGCGEPSFAAIEQTARVEGTVLLVEDEESLRLPVAKMLRKQGFSVIEAADGLSAIELFRAHPAKVDVILLDVTIPGCSSREVIAEAARTRPEIRVILMSAYSREMAADSLNAPQVQDFIRKPFQLRDLMRLLRSAASSQSSGSLVS